jgi:uncharacterized SAM-binding protein YcdF (DUF218 family)
MTAPPPARAARLLRASRLLGATVLMLLALTIATPLPNRALLALSPAPRLEPADAIVVLGGGVDEAGTLSDSSLRRVVHGVELHRRGLAPRLVVFGPEERPGGPREAEIRARLAVGFGVPTSAVMVDASPLTTREEARAASRLLKPLQVRRLLLVTGVQHQLRAGALFRREGFVVLPAPVNEVAALDDDPEDRLRLTRGLLQELVGRVYYRLAGYL